jgi:exodeoxyribonuclease VII large subunit
MTAAGGRLQSETRALGAALRQVVAAEQGRLARTGARLNLTPIRHRVGESDRRLAELGERMEAGYLRLLTERSSRLQAGTALLESYSYRGILQRGFVLVTDDADQRLTSAADAKPGMAVTLEFHDGSAAAVVGSSGVVRKPEPARGTRKTDARSKQGVLF